MKIAVVTLATATIESYANCSHANKMAYCQRQGYDFISEDMIVDGRPPSWGKVPLLQRTLSKYDWLFWTDADSVITNPHLRLERLLDHARDLVISCDQNGPNTGQFLIRNSEWSHRFLKEVWEQQDLINHPWWDNAAVIRLFPLNRRHFRVVPQASLNIYEDAWRPGDFVLHLPGTSIEYRARRLPFFAELAQQSSYEWALTLKDRTEFPKLLNRLGLTGQGVEVGVAAGDFAETMLKSWEGGCLHLIDPWRRLENYHDIYNADDSIQQERFELTQRRMKPFGECCKIHRCTSAEGVSLFSDKSLDFVYLDANHAREFVSQDLVSWYKKIRVGGILAGHDYLDGNLAEGVYGVQSAVTEFARAHQLQVWVTCEREWPSFFLFKSHELAEPAQTVPVIEREAKQLVRNSVAGKTFLYRRVDHDRRLMEFHSDGSIGKGAAAAELTWRFEGEAELVLEGKWGVICRLRSDPVGVFRGRWEQFEKMDIELAPLEGMLKEDPAVTWEPWLGHVLDWGEGCAVDVGANHGLWTRSLAKRYRRVIALEPQIQLAEKLANAQIPNVEVLELAAWCFPTKLRFDIRTEDGTSSVTGFDGGCSATPIRETIEVTCSDLDRLLVREKVDFVKIDTEGTEVFVVEGLRRSLQRDRPTLLVECHSPENAAWCECLFHREGYDVTIIHDPYSTPGEQRWVGHVWVAAKHRSRR